MMWKVLMGILVEQLSYYTEKYHLLLNHHFGGRPGRSTTDAIHLLTYRIKDAWCKGKVASVLFLDIEGAFPNVVPEKLSSNLRKNKVPSKIVDFTKEMLANRATRLRFDDYNCNRPRASSALVSSGTGHYDESFTLSPSRSCMISFGAASCSLMTPPYCCSCLVSFIPFCIGVTCSPARSVLDLSLDTYLYHRSQSPCTSRVAV